MGRAIGAVWQGIRDVYDDLFPFVGMNLIWLIPSLALASIFAAILGSIVLGVGAFGREAPTADLETATYTLSALLGGLMVVIGPNPAGAGFHYYANQKANDQRVEFAVFWEGLRLYWKKALVLFLISIGGVSLLVVNIVFYFTRNDQILGAIGMIFVWVLVIGWLPMQMYAMPLLMEQESKSIKLVVRNSAVLALGNPGFSLVLFVLVVVLTAVSVVIPIIVSLFGGALVAVIEQHAVITLLERYRSSNRS
jgi:uncharacterized membrane protein YesL